MPGRAHAGAGQAVVEPGGRAIAEGVADRRLDWGDDLQEDEDDADDGERAAEVAAVLHRRDQRAHRHGEHRRQQAVQQHHRPPQQRQGPVGVRQRGEELPLLTGAKTLQTAHNRRFSPNRGEGDCKNVTLERPSVRRTRPRTP